MDRSPHLLIIDDIADNIQVAMSILKENHYEFSFALSGAEGLDVARRTADRLDLILLDIMMPELDGYSVCQQLKADPLTRDIPVIFLTARVDVDSVTRGFEVGGVDYLSKPFHAEELLARVRTHLQLYRARQLLQRHNLSLEHKLAFVRERFLTELESSQREMIFLLTELMEANSDETGKHIRRLSEIAALLASLHPSLSAEDAEILRYASPMHDIGKMTIPHEILHKPGPLNEAEFAIMQTHASNGHQLLKNSSRRLLNAAAIIAHQHHEKWDGSGYPQGLKGNDIHIYSRIVALADVFDALTHKRCYKDAWPPLEALAFIQAQRGRHFDPQLVDLFSNHFQLFCGICEQVERSDPLRLDPTA